MTSSPLARLADRIFTRFVSPAEGVGVHRDLIMDRGERRAGIIVSAKRGVERDRRGGSCGNFPSWSPKGCCILQTTGSASGGEWRHSEGELAGNVSGRDLRDFDLRSEFNFRSIANLRSPWRSNRASSRASFEQPEESSQTCLWNRIRADGLRNVPLTFLWRYDRKNANT